MPLAVRVQTMPSRIEQLRQSPRAQMRKSLFLPSRTSWTSGDANGNSELQENYVEVPRMYSECAPLVGVSGSGFGAGPYRTQGRLSAGKSKKTGVGGRADGQRHPDTQVCSKEPDFSLECDRVKSVLYLELAKQ